MILLMFFSVDFDKIICDCEEYWFLKWMGIVYSIILFLILVVFFLVLMIGLYL